MNVPQVIQILFNILTIIFSIMIMINSYKAEKILKRKIDELKRRQ